MVHSHMFSRDAVPGGEQHLFARVWVALMLVLITIGAIIAPLRIVLGSQALDSTIVTLRKRIASFEAQTDLAASTDFPPGA